MSSTYLVLSRAGSQRDLAKDSRAQPYWDEHAVHIDRYVANGMIVMGGPLVDDGGAVLVVQADDEASVRAMLAADPWYERQILTLERIARWHIFIDERFAS